MISIIPCCETSWAAKAKELRSPPSLDNPRSLLLFFYAGLFDAFGPVRKTVVIVDCLCILLETRLRVRERGHAKKHGVFEVAFTRTLCLRRAHLAFMHQAVPCMLAPIQNRRLLFDCLKIRSHVVAWTLNSGRPSGTGSKWIIN